MFCTGCFEWGMFRTFSYTGTCRMEALGIKITEPQKYIHIVGGEYFMVYFSTESHSGCMPRDGIYLIALSRIVSARGVHLHEVIHGSQEMERQAPDHGFRVLGHVWIVERMQLMRHTLLQRSILQTICISRSCDFKQARFFSTQPSTSSR